MPHHALVTTDTAPLGPLEGVGCLPPAGTCDRVWP
jgi:hypothetical protein